MSLIPFSVLGKSSAGGLDTGMPLWLQAAGEDGQDFHKSFKALLGPGHPQEGAVPAEALSKWLKEGEPMVSSEMDGLEDAVPLLPILEALMNQVGIDAEALATLSPENDLLPVLEALMIQTGIDRESLALLPPEDGLILVLESLLAQADVDDEAWATLSPEEGLSRLLESLMNQAGVDADALAQKSPETALATLAAAWRSVGNPGAEPVALTDESRAPRAGHRPELNALAAAVAQVLQSQSVPAGEERSVMPQALHALVGRMSTESTPAGRDTTPLTPLASETTLSSQTSSTAPRPLEVTVPLSRPNWGQAVGSRVLWMVNHNMQAAELRLNPAQLGPVDVRIAMEGDRANIQFLAHHAQTREALDAALPRLREMFSEQGIQLVNVDVSGRQSGGQGGDDALANGGLQGEGADQGDDLESAARGEGDDRASGTGLLDAYA
ncbi:Flagellar hook-length control protein FliK [Ectothiorhodospira magna]|uniref:Flagellar hook-length control protein FliK n=1 Tax=Ectothiorhodospira magna TaxID=867345 RepID=A0A1H9DXB1_9GAMM|nr:flagellar hook-length control protein FliK [Ectothiorhodospira magna]SEQ18129.1 Flagellar hook-length control protein FliK [Ectothiorhodospira magna]